MAENKDGTWRTTGLKAKDKDKLLFQFWNTINNRKKVNVNLLKDDDVEVYTIKEDLIIVIYVPMAKREEKPVYIRGVVIKNEPDRLIFENPGYIRTGKVQMRKGGESDPRNKSLMKMFNLINIGERSGSGVPLIFNTWQDQGWKEPVIEERFDPDRTILVLEFIGKQVKKTSEENKRRKQAKKASEENRQRKQAEKNK